MAWADPFPLADVKRIGHRLDATVNDLLMAAATGALRHHLLRKGESVDGPKRPIYLTGAQLKQPMKEE